MSGALAIQTAIYDRLTGYSALTDLLSSGYFTTAVFDHVPQKADPENEATFPYVVIGEDTLKPWDTMTETGTEATITIHTWSTSGNFAEVKAIQQQIYNALHRYDGLSVTGYTVIGIDIEFEDAQKDPDGQTRHGVQRFRLVMDKAACTFPLDATESELQTAGLTAKLTPSNADQTGSYTIQSGLASNENYGMAPAGSSSGTSQDIDVSSGIKAVGLTKDALPDVGAAAGVSSGDVGILLRLFNKSTLATVAELQYGVDSTGPWIGDNAGAIYRTDGSQASIYLDAGTGNWGFGYKDTGGADQITVEGTFTATNVVPLLIVFEQASVSAAFAGETVTATLHTDSITAPVAADSVNPCGAVIY